MKKIAILIIVLANALTSFGQDTPYKRPVTYTPMASNYQFTKQVKVDSLLTALKGRILDTAYFDKAFVPTPSVGDSSNKIPNTRWVKDQMASSGIPTVDGLVSGGVVTWVTGLTFDVGPAVWRINGVLYTKLTTTQITLAVSDPSNPRYDLIVLNTSGTADDITGTPSSNPVQPVPDPASQVGLAYIHIAAGATVPTGVSNEVIYSDNAEWTGTGDYTGLNFNYTTNPFSGTKSTYVTSGTGNKYIKYTNGSTVNSSDYTTLKFYIRLNNSVPGSTAITLTFFNGVNPVSSGVQLTPALGYNRNTVNSWQVITIPLSAFTFSSNAFDALQFRTTQTIGSFQLDEIFLQTGLPIISNTGVSSFNGRTGAVVPVATDYSSYYLPLTLSGDKTVNQNSNVLTFSNGETIFTDDNSLVAAIAFYNGAEGGNSFILNNSDKKFLFNPDNLGYSFGIGYDASNADSVFNVNGSSKLMGNTLVGGLLGGDQNYSANYDSLSYVQKVYVDNKTDSGFIPLAGTASGLPVTGVIETDNDFALYSQNGSDYLELGIFKADKTVRLLRSTAGGDVQLLLDNDEYINFDAPESGRGLRSGKDYSPNIDDLSYTQKIYVGFRGTATLSSGSVTVATDKIKTGYKIYVSCNTPSGTQGFLSAPVASIINETSFVINSSSASDNSTVNWWIAP